MAIELMPGLLIDGLTMALSTQEALERAEPIGFHVEVLAWIHHQQRLSPESVVSLHGKNFPFVQDRWVPGGAWLAVAHLPELIWLRAVEPSGAETDPRPP